MSNEKYIGLDVHQATISVAVMDSRGKLVMESIVETKAATILEFFAGLRGTLLVTFEEGTWAAWLYDLLRPHVSKVVVCNPRKNALLKHGNKSDRIDAWNLADLLRLNRLEAVYHGETSVRMLRELARSYLTIVKDLSRVMNRLKALYRSWAIPCAGRDVYYTRHRNQWLEKIPEAGTRRRAEQLYQQLALLQQNRRRHALCGSCGRVAWRLHPTRSGSVLSTQTGLCRCVGAYSLAVLLGRVQGWSYPPSALSELKALHPPALTVPSYWSGRVHAQRRLASDRTQRPSHVPSVGLQLIHTRGILRNGPHRCISQHYEAPPAEHGRSKVRRRQEVLPEGRRSDSQS